MTTKQPLISVITVTFNAADYLEETIRSVAGQTYQKIEYLIIDGASTDGTLDIIKKNEAYISSWFSEPDEGLYDAMNKGIHKARGDYLIFMNAGDKFHTPDTLKKAMEGADNADFIYGLARRVTENGEVKPWHKKTPKPERIGPKSFLNGMVICHQSMIVKKSIAPDFGGKYKIANDIDWAIRGMKKVQKVHFYNDYICDFLEGGVSDQGRLKSLKERWDLQVEHFGVWLAFWGQIRIIIHYLSGYFKHKVSFS